MVENSNLSENHKFIFNKFEVESKRNLDAETELIKSDASLHYKESFQLFHDHSKRYLCFSPLHKHSLQENINKDSPSTNILILSFWEFPNENTHFMFEQINWSDSEPNEVSIASAGRGRLTCIYQGVKHYLYFPENEQYCLLGSEKKMNIQMNWMSQCRQVDDGDNQDSEIQVINYAYLICNSNKKCLKYRLDYIGSQNPIKCIDQTNIETANYGYFWKVTINKKARSVEFLHLLENQVIQADRDKKIFNDFQNKNSNRSDNQSYSNESEEEEYDGGSMSGSDESSDKDIKLGVKRFSNNEGRKLNMNNDESKLFKLEIDGDFDKVVEKLMEGNEFSVTTSNNVYLVYKDSGNGTEGCFKLVQNDDSINLNKFNFHKFHLAPVNNNHIDNISLVETIRKYLSLIKRFVKVFIKQKNSLKEYYSVYLQIKKLMKIIKQVLDDSYGPFSSLSSQKDDQK